VARAQDDAREVGFAGVLHKPFEPTAIEELVLRHFESSKELVTTKENVITVAPFRGKESRLHGYYTQVAGLLGGGLEEVAAACFAEAVVDISQLPIFPEKTARLVLEMSDRGHKVGVEVLLVGSVEVARSLKQLAETAQLRVFPSVAAAQASVAA